MLQEMTYEQFLEWLEFNKTNPIGGKRGDWQAASIVSIIANMGAAFSGSRKRWSPKDFLLEFGGEVKKLEDVEGGQKKASNLKGMKQLAKMWTAIVNAELAAAEKPKQKKRNRRG